MYKFLPLDENIMVSDERMLEANLLLLHRSDSTKEILKWSVLCASTLECINPHGSTVHCDVERKDEKSVCNRQDQSVFSILTYNMERDFLRRGFATIRSGEASHPSRTKQRHQTRRGQWLHNDKLLVC